MGIQGISGDPQLLKQGKSMPPNQPRPDAGYNEPVPGRGIDPVTRQLTDGYYRTNIKTNEVEFTPGSLPGIGGRMNIDDE